MARSLDGLAPAADTSTFHFAHVLQVGGRREWDPMSEWARRTVSTAA